jgi:hypothetical protein
MRHRRLPAVWRRGDTRGSNLTAGLQLQAGKNGILATRRRGLRIHKCGCGAVKNAEYACCAGMLPCHTCWLFTLHVCIIALMNITGPSRWRSVPSACHCMAGFKHTLTECRQLQWRKQSAIAMVNLEWCQRPQKCMSPLLLISAVL